MSDLIDRQVAIDVVGDWIYNPEDLRYHKDVINSIPAVQPEIIRCKDCRFRDNSDEYSLPCSPESDVICGDDFYCAYAERRTDGQCKSD